MRHGPDLIAWLDDPDAPAHAREAAVETARAVNAIPALAAFREALTGETGDRPVEDAVARLFSDTVWCGDLVAMLCERLDRDPFFIPPQQAADSGLHQALVVHEDVRVSIALGVGGIDALAARKVADHGRRALILPGRRSRLRFLRGGGATLAFHALDAEGRLRAAGRRRMADGDGFTIDGRRATWVVDHAAGDMVLLQATLKDDAAPHVREFDPATGAELARSTTDEAASRMQMLISLLGAMDRSDATDAIAGCLAHDAAFVRWHAMRELVALDDRAALPRLIGLAARDPEREVRDAARTTLALLREEAPCPA